MLIFGGSTKTSRKQQPINQPGSWDVMISYTQTDGKAEVEANELYHGFVKRGWKPWMDIKMDKCDTAAMNEAVVNCRAVVFVVSSPSDDKDEPRASLNRKFCRKELRWAIEKGTFIQPVIAMRDKERIGFFISQAPDDLKCLGNVNFLHLDRTAPRRWETSLDLVIEAIEKDGGPSTNDKTNTSGGASSVETKASGGVSESEEELRQSKTRCVMIGDCGVGKSCILGALCNENFNHSRESTIAVGFETPNIEEERWMIWDTQGQHSGRSVTTSLWTNYYRDADVVMVVYDVTVRKTFENVDSWIKLVRENAPASAICFLVGNKIDLEQRAVPKEDALKKAADNGLCYFEVSALHETNFPAFKQKLFLRRRLAIRDRARQNEGAGSTTVNLKANRKRRKRGGCC